MSNRLLNDVAYHFIFYYNFSYFMGRGGALVELMHFDGRSWMRIPLWPPRRDLGFSLAVACGALAGKLRHSVNFCGRERFSKAHAVRSSIGLEKDKYNTIQYSGSTMHTS